MEYEVYHGRIITDPNFDLKYVGSENAKDQHGPGFYFTDNITEAASYAGTGGIIIHAKIKIDRPLTNKRKASPRELEFMIRNGDPITLENFGENRISAIRKAIKTYSDDNRIEAMQTIWNDFYMYEPQKYLENLTKLGYDGSIHQLGDPEMNKGHAGNVYVVYNPKNINVLEVIPYEKYESKLVESSSFVGFLDRIEQFDPVLVETVKHVYSETIDFDQKSI